jgi:nucleoside-diphosphate-sugar epimerase
MKVLVTGAAGFIGFALAKALAARGDKVLATDIRQSDALAILCLAHPSKVVFRPCEVTEWAQMADGFEVFRPDAAVHCAAVVGVANSVASPIGTMRINVEGSLNLFNLARLHKVRRVVNLSSEEVYGPFEADVIDEDHPCRPLRPYGISKYAVERLAGDFSGPGMPDIVHLRISWAYGPGLPRPRVPKIFVDAAVAGQSLKLASGAGFSVDHTYIDDAVAGLLCALDVDAHDHDVYNIGSGKALSLAEIVAIVRSIVPNADIGVGPGGYEFQPGVPAIRKGALDVTRARDELGYEPKFDIRKGLEAYLVAELQARAGGV